jgi:cell division protein FtsB
MSHRRPSATTAATSIRLKPLRIEYLGEKEQAAEFMKQPVKTQAQADKVAIWAKRLTAIKAKAEGLAQGREAAAPRCRPRGRRQMA